MVALLRHQRESESGTSFAPDIGVYGGWTAHAGSFAARQSAADDGSPDALIFAGECVGEHASPKHEYRTRGDDFVEGLNGLFSGLLIDRDRRRALLFNDRFGSERLYTFQKDGATYFASEAKALLAVLPELRAFDETGVAQWLAFGSTSAGRTLFRGLTLLPGGSVWHFEPGAPLQQHRYFVPALWEAMSPLPADEFEGRLSDTFNRILPAYLDGTNVGLSLTGGLDTRMIAACIPHDLKPAVAYTYAANEGDRLRDLTIARQVAASLGIKHHALRIDKDFLAHFPQHLDRTVWTSDGTAGALGAHELPLSEQARSLAQVRLTGNYGSEVLRAMTTFKRSGPSDELLDARVVVQVNAVVAERQEGSGHPVTRAAFEEVPWHLFGALAVGRSQLTLRTPFMDNRIVELAYRAPLSSRLHHQPSLRVIHDHDPALAAVPTDRGVAWGATSARARVRRLFGEVSFKLDYWHTEGLPDRLTRVDALFGPLSHLGLLGMHKFLAYRSWFRKSLATYAEQVLADARTRALPFWNPATLATIARDHVSGRRNRLRDIHAVLTLEAVQRLLIDDDAYRKIADAID